MQFDYDKLSGSILQYDNSIAELKIKTKQGKEEKEKQLRELKGRLDVKNRQLEDLLHQKQLATEIICRYTGTVLDVLRTEGRMVQPDLQY